MDSNKTVTVEDLGTFPVSDDLSIDEIRRNLKTLLGAPWLDTAAYTVDEDGNITFSRPSAGSKG